MKKLHLLLCAIAVIFVSCSSNEEKAEKLIKESLNATLYHPESYEPISTRVDSAFINFENLAKVGELFSELGDLLQKQKEYKQKCKWAESTMSIYAPTRYYYDEHSRVQYNQYKQELNEYQEKLDKITPKIDVTITQLKKVAKNIYSDEFTGWIVSHRFKSKNGVNTMKLPGNMVFICDKEFTQCGSGMDTDDFNKLFKLINKFSETEDVEELKEDILEIM